MFLLHLCAKLFQNQSAYVELRGQVVNKERIILFFLPLQVHDMLLQTSIRTRN